MKNNMNLKSFLCGGLMALMVGGVFESECARADRECARADPEYARAGDIAEMIKTSKDRLAGLVKSSKWIGLPAQEKKAAVDSVACDILRQMSFTPMAKRPLDDTGDATVLLTKDGPVAIVPTLRWAVHETRFVWEKLSGQGDYSGGADALRGPYSRVDAGIIADRCSEGGTYLFHAFISSLLRSRSLPDGTAENLLKAFEYGLETYVEKMTAKNPFVRTTW
jgi:hypothetical protein